MKKILSIIFLCIFFYPISTIYSQWVIQNSPVTSSLTDVTFININTGWICGDGGVIIKTTNRGTNWFIQNSGVSNILSGIHAIDSDYIYCDGWWNTILKSTNGGNNWTIIRNGVSSSGISFYGIYFLNRNTGWLLRNNYILKTVNGGITFDSTHEIFTYLRDAFFKDSLEGVLCGEGSLIMKSTDSGVNWNQIQIPLYNFEIPDFYKETFIGNYGWVVGYYNDNGGPLTWRTTNFGTSWDTIGRVPYPPIIGNYCVYFSSLNTGWCGGESGYIFKTTNGGFNWFRQQTPSSNFRRSMYFYNDSIGWAVGGGGQILFTTTSGQWVDVKNISSEIPKKYKLYQNYPNPFNSKTIIDYELPVTDFVFLTINDVLGKQIIILKNRTQNAGKYRVEWDATNFSSGIYYCTFFTNSYRETRKIVLIK